MRSGEDVRREVARRLRREPDPRAWEWLAEEHYPGDVLDEEDEDERKRALSELVEKVRRLEERIGGRKTRAREGVVAPERRLLARARLQALEAAALEPVQAFRREVLRGPLLPPARMHAWMTGQAKRQGETEWFTREELRRASWSEPDRLEVVRWRVRLRLFVVAEDADGKQHRGFAPVRLESPLGRLYAVARHLAARFGWGEAEAAGFVLTGRPPAAYGGTWAVEEGAEPEADRIVLRVQPDARPVSVRDAFSTARRAYLAERGAAPAPQELSDRKVELALFVAERGPEPWAALREAWNRERPAWAYSDVRNLRRDARMAYERLRGKPLPSRPRWRGTQAAHAKARPRGGRARR